MQRAVLDVLEAYSSSTPSYTALMGHWSELLVDEVAERVGQGADRSVLKGLLKEVASEIELLSGRAFGQTDLRSEILDSGGFPFVDVPDAHITGFSSDR